MQNVLSTEQGPRMRIAKRQQHNNVTSADNSADSTLVLVKLHVPTQNKSLEFSRILVP